MRSLLTELLVVALGVLLALWAEQWWSGIRQSGEENRYLQALSEDVDQAVMDIEATNREVQEWLTAAADLSALQGQSETLAEEQAAMLMGTALLNIEVYEISLGAYQDLLVTGRVGLISNPEIRNSLTRLDQKIEELRTAEVDLAETQHHIIDRFLIKYTNLSALSRVGYSEADKLSAQQSGGPLAPALITNRLEFDHRPIVDSRELQNIIALRIILVSELLVGAIEVKQVLLKLREQLESTE